MQVFKTFFKIAKKHLAQVLVYVSVFLILIFMMSFSAKKSSTDQFTAKSVDIVILDNDNTALSQGIYDYLDSRHNIIELEHTDYEALTDNLFYQRISYVLIIPKGFEESFVTNGDLKLTHNMREDSAAGFFVNHQLDGFLDSVALYQIGGFTLDEAIASTLQNLADSPEVENIVFDEKATGGNDTMFYYFQYIGYIFLMIFAVSLVPILVTFHDRDINARISCSSAPAKSRNFQIGLGCICYSVLTWFLFILLATIVFKPSNVFSEQGLMCLANSFVFTLICTSITLLLSTFNLKDNSLNLISNIIGLGMSFLCGVFVPQWILGSSVIAVGKFLPAYWYIKIINMVTGWSGEAYSIASFWRYLGIEVVFLVAIFFVYLVANKQRKKASLV